LARNSLSTSSSAAPRRKTAIWWSMSKVIVCRSAPIRL
jgi:hypothetical protein